MIKFFRNIRQNLLSEGKTSKYFKYAIGEIILVVIGILIALQINNWNESRKEKIKAKSFLINIKEDLTLDTIQFNTAAEHVNNAIIDATRLLELKSFTKHKIDTIISLIPNTYYEYSINSQTFDKLINSGVTELSNYNDIFELINIYYTKQKNFYQSVRDWDIEETKKDNDIFLSSSNFEISSVKYGNFSTQFYYIQSEKDRREGLTKLLLSVKSRNRIRNALFRKKRIALTYDETNTEAKKIIDSINKKLND